MSSIDDQSFASGSSSGIGAATAVLFSKFGSKLVIHGRNETRIKKVASQCEVVSPFGYKPLEIVADIANLEEIRRLVKQTIDCYAKLDIFVCNAAIFGTPVGILDENVMQCMEEICFTKIRATTLLCHLLLPHLIESKGSLLYVSSVCSSFPCFDETLFCFHVTDAATDAMFKNFAREFGPKGVRVNTVNPFVVNTPANQTLPTEARQLLENQVKNTALECIAEPEDIANSIVFLCSEASRSINGHSLFIDGGFTYK